MEEDAGDYLYSLAGIVVHAGVAQGGHYYSYIRDRGKQAYEDDNVKGDRGGRGNNGSGGRVIAGVARAVEGADGGKVKTGFIIKLCLHPVGNCCYYTAVNSRGKF